MDDESALIYKKTRLLKGGFFTAHIRQVLPYPWQTSPLQHEPSLEMAIVNERTHSQILQDKSPPHQCLAEADALSCTNSIMMHYNE
ncbi:hypothetical protein [Bacillus sp. FMQ74]|uniref:hypothetical protein n=1 Tax=Bacillus sp. FMQ74 TaxID=1913579 RepID=UPI0009F41968|nr:hypothetical protein [Bacillus sp. FMQ74]